MHYSKVSPGLWIIQTHGTVGRMGCISRVFLDHTCEVQFGTDGPFVVLRSRSFRPATKEEKKAFGTSNYGVVEPQEWSAANALPRT
jgi:hypothetical protein